MKTSILIFLVLAAGLPAAAEVRGTQAVLLHCFDSTSTSNIGAAVIESGVGHFALSSAPFLPSDHGCHVPPKPLANLISVTGRIRLNGIQTHLTVFLGGLHDPAPAASLAANMWSLWTDLIVPNSTDAGVSFAVGGSLEDKYLDEAAAASAMTVMADALRRRRGETSDTPAQDRKKLLRSLVAQHRFEFHRAPNGDHLPAKITLTAMAFLDDVTINVTHEMHGTSPQSGYSYWSNDGPFVYHNDSTLSETCDCGVSGSESLKGFEGTSFSGSYRLLWRPAYNLFPYATNGGTRPPTRMFTKITPPRSDGASSGFDDREKAVLKRYLANLP